MVTHSFHHAAVITRGSITQSFQLPPDGLNIIILVSALCPNFNYAVLLFYGRTVSVHITCIKFAALRKPALTYYSLNQRLAFEIPTSMNVSIHSQFV